MAWALVCDPGIDDAVALAVLVGLGVPPDLVVAVPGNAGLEATARNAAGLVCLLGLDVPVRSFAAAQRPVPEGTRGSAHGDDGIGGMADHLPTGAEVRPLAVDELPAELLVTGALTCAAAASSIERLVWMGGAIEGGNVTPIAEFNAWSDPDAADRVLATVPGAQLVPLDVTRQVPLGPDDLSALDRGGVTAQLLARALRARPKLFVHDAVSAVAWVRPDLFDWRPMGLRCEQSGALVPDAARAPVEVAVGLDVEAVRRFVLDGVLAADAP